MPSSKTIIIPPERLTYLHDIAEETVRKYHQWGKEQAQLVKREAQIEETIRILQDDPQGNRRNQEAIRLLKEKKKGIDDQIDPQCRGLVKEWPQIVKKYSKDEYIYEVRGKEIRVPLKWESLAGTEISKVSLPQFEDPGEILKWLLEENIPGLFPYTSGVFPLKRTMKIPPGCLREKEIRLEPIDVSNFFPKTILPSACLLLLILLPYMDKIRMSRPDIYGKIGNAGVSVCTFDDMKTLYDGFDLSSPDTSVSMTINGPAPIILAMFFNTAIDQQIEKFEEEHERKALPDEIAKIKAKTLRQVRGTVQADILKEDQGQNTCIFSTEFALRMMGDTQEYFVENHVNNFYSVSISGYHIAEAGANPISQLAFTLANGFTYLEYYIAGD